MLYYIQEVRESTKKGAKDMTKMELARKQAQHIAEATGDQNIERIAKVLYKGMTINELKKAIANWSK
jgi:hypothetical protein